MRDSEKRLNGSCLCKAVSISIDSNCNDLGAYHYPKCQTWSGSAFMEVECGTDVIFEGSNNIATFESSSLAERGFCRICGTHLFIKDRRSGEYGVPSGLYGDNSNFKFNRQLFFDKKLTFIVLKMKQSISPANTFISTFQKLRNRTGFSGRFWPRLCENSDHVLV